MAKTRCFLLCVIFWILSSCYILNCTIASSSEGLLHYLSKDISPSGYLFSRRSPSYTSILKSSIRNPIFFNNITSRPLYIITPTETSHIQTTVICGRRQHNFEGLSYRSENHEPSAVVDLSKMRSVLVDAKRDTAWVQSGATLGELYYAISKETPGFGFPAGVCPTVGIGGHFSGGGFGMLQRKYGLAADHILNATLVDAEGRLLHRESMGKDLFWAIRGGGGGSFGIVVSWQVKLVPVPRMVTLFTIEKTLDQGAINTLTNWQQKAPNMSEDIMVRAVVRPQSVFFQSQYLGTCDQLLPLMHDHFPELGMNRRYCKEMAWIESIPYMHLGSNATVNDILNRSSISETYTKNKSDYVSEAIPTNVWKKIFSRAQEVSNFGEFEMFLDPYGGKIGSIDESTTPFPHRKGVLYNIQYITFWKDAANETLAMKWIRGFYKFMEQYVSKDPRQAYVNYRDLELGANKVVDDITSYHNGKVWGEKYFKHNFDRLATVKAKVDPSDYFRNEESIPPLFK